MAGTWLTVGTNFAGEASGPKSNFPTQKSVGVLGQDAHSGEILTGSIVVCFTDYSSALTRPVRRFFLLNYGSSSWNEITSWLPISGENTPIKHVSTSFVISGTTIYAITTAELTGTSDNRPRVIVGSYNLDTQGLNGSWTSQVIHTSETVQDYNHGSDIAVSDSGEEILLAWAQDEDTNNNLYRIYKLAYNPGVGYGNTYSVVVYYGGGNPKVTLVHDIGEYFYVHFSGTRDGTSDTSELYNILYTSPFPPLIDRLATPNMGDAAVAKSSETGDLAFVVPTGNYMLFDYYDVSAAEMDEQQAINAQNPVTSFGYSVTFRAGKWHCIFWDNGEVVHKIRDEGSTSSGVLWDTVPGETPPTEQTDYYGALAVSNPSSVDPDFWGMVALDVDGNGPTYSMYFYKSGNVLIPPESTGGFWDKGICSGGGTIDVSTENLSMSRRGTGSSGIERLRVIGHARLEDETIIVTDGEKIYYFDEDTYDYDGVPDTLTYQSSFQPQDGARKRAVWARVSYETDGSDPSITIGNDDNSSKGIGNGSDTQLRVNHMGRRFNWVISHQDDSDLVVNGVELEVIKTNDE